MPPESETSTVAAKPQADLPINGAAQLAKPTTSTDLTGAITGRTVVWNAERVELIKRTIMPPGATNDEFAVFLAQCQRTQMDPLIGEAYCVPRSVQVSTGKKDGRGYDIKEYVTKNVFQLGEQGMEARADRFEDFRGLSFAAYHANDKILVNKSAGTVTHEYSPVEKNRGELVGAWAIVERVGRRPTVVDIKLSERIQKKSNGDIMASWRNPQTMIEKCARMAALRLAYPNTYGGLYIEGEFPDLDEKEVNAAPRSQEQHDNGGTTRTERVKERVTQSAQKPQPAPTDAEIVEPTARFGPDGVKGRRLADLSPEQLQVLKERAETNLMKEPNATWAPGIRTNLEEVDAEIAKRAARPPVEREPGSDDGDPKAPF
jgi:phage recombination protein Bet